MESRPPAGSWRRSIASPISMGDCGLRVGATVVRAAAARSVALFAIYMVLAYLAIAAYGKALLATGLAPRWVARTLLIFGLLGAVGFVARIPVFNPPLMIHLVTGIVGVVLLLRLRGG